MSRLKAISPNVYRLSKFSPLSILAKTAVMQVLYPVGYTVAIEGLAEEKYPPATYVLPSVTERQNSF